MDVCVPAQVRLMEEAPSYSTYYEAYEVNCARYGREPDMPIIAFKQRCADARGQVAQDASSAALRQQTFAEVCAHIVNENVFSQYAYKSLPSSTHLWVFKKQLCSQTALSGGCLGAGARVRVLGCGCRAVNSKRYEDEGIGDQDDEVCPAALLQGAAACVDAACGCRGGRSQGAGVQSCC